MDNAYPGMLSDPKPTRTYEEFLMDAHWFIVMGNTAARAVLSAFLRQSTIYPTTIAYTTLDLFNWYNSNLLARRGYDKKRIQKDVRFSKHFKMGQVIQLVRYVQMVLEMSMHRYAPQHRMVAIILVEFVKFVLKTISAFTNSPPMFINPTVLPSESLMSQEVLPPQPAIRLMGILQRKPTDMLLAPTLTGGSHKMLKLGELLYAIRPLVYACLVAKYGFQSWIPWGASLSVDLSAMLASRYAITAAQHDLGVVVEDELNYRKPSIWNYLFKSPAFDWTLGPVFDKWISTTGWVGTPISYWLRYMKIMQEFFYYTEE